MTVENQTNYEVAYTSLKRDILAGSYRPGVSISIGDVEKRLGMSRTPIRVALQRLSEEKLLEVLPRQGFRVPLISRKELADVQEVLAGLELLAIDSIHERCSKEDLRPLLDAVKKMRSANDADDLKLWSEADAEFHKKLLVLSGNDVLFKCANQFLEQMWRVRALTRMMRPVPVQSTDAHAALVDALLAKDLPLARSIHSQQRRRSAGEIDKIIERLETNLI
ncbi:GntR family transcriptional regulator [Rhizobium sp. GN54]|uniref:GntR family transcriptional regulator n=1 Tax=Rhizobium sp. GN54 TaxID=2898150 RepID=UPI001E31F1E2|nr:GntR family transcriptional regulator [Rhizobium sp. GN54]MCD2184918.1 GntR family transcriptional regulator [Rhizobium sp. GN54]